MGMRVGLLLLTVSTAIGKMQDESFGYLKKDVPLVMED